MTKNHIATATGTAAATAPIIQRQRRPATNSTNTPEARISSDVPRSGCLRISATGTRISARLIAMCLKRGGSERLERYQAMVIGMTIFITSEGWKRMTPGMLIQRVAPIAVCPINSTATSKETPPT
jgi:hypothetical protein